MYGRNIKAYNRTKLEAEMLVATPYRITQMLFEGLIERINQAKRYMQSNDPANRAKFISKAVGILNGLQGAIDPTYDEELGNRIIGLYEYMKNRLNEANITNDTAPLDEVIKLITPIKEAWDQIPEEIRDEQNRVIMDKLKAQDDAQRDSNRQGYAFSEPQQS